MAQLPSSRVFGTSYTPGMVNGDFRTNFLLKGCKQKV